MEGLYRPPHLYDRLEPSPGIGDLAHEIDHDPNAIFWGEPQASTQGRQLTVPRQACPTPCSPDRQQSKDLTDARPAQAQRPSGADADPGPRCRKPGLLT